MIIWRRQRANWVVEKSNGLFSNLRRKNVITKNENNYFRFNSKKATNLGELYLLAKVFARYLDDWSSPTLVALWCSGYHYCTTSFNKAWTQVLRRFKPCSWRVGDSQWWGFLTMVPAGNKAKRLSSFNLTTKAIHHHHHYQLWNPYWKSFRILGSPFTAYNEAWRVLLKRHRKFLSKT